MKFWYEGNLNKKENKREANGIIYYIRGLLEHQDGRYERYAVQTHFIEQGEDYISLIARYVAPLYQEGDILVISEKIIAMCQNHTVEKEDVKLGFWAKFLSRFATKTPSGIGMDEPYKLQLAIDMKGLPLVLWATLCSAVGKVFKKRGVFYQIVGQEVAGIDGFYTHSAFKRYHNLAVLNPKNPEKVCQEIYHKLIISNMIVDANDIDVTILGRSSDLNDYTKEQLAALIEDNPAGQDDECTPFILIRDIGQAPAEAYVPIEASVAPIYGA